MAINNSTNLYTDTKYVVSSVGATPYATIQAAINAANAAGIPAKVHIRPGTYTENLTLYSNIDLEGSENSQVTIVGVHTPPTSGALAFNRIGFSSSTHVLSSASAGTTTIKFSRCVFSVTNGYICNLTNWTGAISIKYCTEGTSTSNGVITNAGAAAITIYNSIIGAGTANAMTANGSVDLFNVKLWCPLTVAGSSAVLLEGGSTFKGTITTSATVGVKIRNSTISTDTATAISHSSSTAMLLNNVVVDSTNATCIAGTGSIQFNEATFVNSKTLAGTITEVLTGVVKTGEIFADTITRMECTGFYSWGGAGNYYDDTTLGSFTVSRPGSGYIKGRLVTWTAPQTVSSMTSGSTWYIYIDSTGTIGKTNAHTDALYVDYIPLFECLYDETPTTKVQYTVKENHPYNFQTGPSNYLHDTVGPVIQNASNGANIVAGSDTVKVGISVDDVLSDHGLDTNIVATTGATWNKMYKTAGGKWARDGAAGTDFAGHWNNAGTVATLTGSRTAVYRLYVTKDNLTSTAPQYFAVLHTSDYSNNSSALTAIGNGSIVSADGELAALEMAQLGYITFHNGAIDSIIISKATLKSVTSTSGTNIAGLITTSVTNFNGLLSTADTNVQAALDTLDNWGQATDGQLIIGKTSNPSVLGTLTASTGITVANGAGTITLSAVGTTLNTQTDSYTLLIADAGKLVQMNKSTANTLTVPKNSSVAFATGTLILVAQIGAGQTTIAPVDGDVTIYSTGSYTKLFTQYSMALLVKTATNTWILAGDITS